jgi:hypothetical protein
MFENLQFSLQFIMSFGLKDVKVSWTFVLKDVIESLEEYGENPLVFKWIDVHSCRTLLCRIWLQGWKDPFSL